MSRVRVEIDLNSLRSDGTTRVRLANASGAVKRGDIVDAFESEDEVVALAWVDRVDEARGVAFITVNRDSMRDDTAVAEFNYARLGSNRAMAATGNRSAAVNISARRPSSVRATRLRTS